MVARLIWSPQSLQDLDAICSHIAKDSKFYAGLFAEGVFELAEHIAAFPRSGRVVPEYRRASLRERIFQDYRIVYSLVGGQAEIVAIVHGARILKRIVGKRWV